MLRDETVRRRHWLEDAELLDLFGTLSVLPGPSSTQLAIVLSRRRAGWAGLLQTGVRVLAVAVLIVAAPLAARLTERLGTGEVAAAWRGKQLLRAVYAAVACRPLTPPWSALPLAAGVGGG